ncbi:MAG: LAGLIDADG family homing endonuclease [Candidatus Nanoarchaeia archaeon]
MPFDIIIGRDEEDTKALGKQGVVLIGKSYVRMGRTTSLSNPLFLDIARGHVIYIVGKRGSGKCLTGDTLIQLEDGSQMPIQELKDNPEKVFGLNDKLKINSMAKEDFFEREVDCIVKMRMRSGREIKLTPEHPLLTIQGWIPANQLTLRDRIAVPRNISSFGKEELPEHEAKLMAYLIAEGHTKERYILFSNTDEKLISDFKESLNKFDENMELVEDNKGCYRVKSKELKREVISYNIIRDSLGRFGKGTSIEHKKKSIREFSEKTGMHNLLSAQKIIPEAIFKAKREPLKVFLNRLFSCDGSIYRLKRESSWEVSYASSSEKLIRQVQSLLLRFGVLSKLRSKKTKCNGKLFNTFELAIDGANVQKFIEEIGFFGEKEARQEQALKESVKITRNPNVDTIPKEIWDIDRPKNWAEVGTQMGYSSGKALRSSIAYAPSRQKLLQIAEYDNAEQMKLLATSDIFWDEIASLEVMEGKFKVYDICVPEFHNFVANDIIVHNSYTMGAIAEGIMDLPDDLRKNLSMIMMDTMGVYWTTKYPNQKDEDLLEMWGLEPKGINVRIYTPKGFYQKYKDDGIPTDAPFSIKPSDLGPQDWILSFELDTNNPVAVVIEKVLGDILDENLGNYSIKDIIERIQKDDSFNQDIKNDAINRFKAADRWGLFDEEGMDLMDLVVPGQVTIMDLSPYVATPGGWGVKALVIGLIGMRVFTQRMLARKSEELEAIKVGYSYFQAAEEMGNKEPIPIVWVVVDEAHEFLPKDGKTAATNALVTIMREGRQPGVCLILATQQPGKIHSDVMSQSDIIIAHRLTAKPDVDALASMSQSYLAKGLPHLIDELPRVKGAALILDDNSERFYPMRVRPRMTWHGGAAPSAIKYKRKVEFGI